MIKGISLKLNWPVNYGNDNENNPQVIYQKITYFSFRFFYQIFNLFIYIYLIICVFILYSFFYVISYLRCYINFDTFILCQNNVFFYVKGKKISFFIILTYLSIRVCIIFYIMLYFYCVLIIFLYRINIM